MNNFNSKNIVFIEHQCTGIVHASLNALWIISFLKATQKTQAILICETSHNVQIQKKLQDNNSSIKPTFVPIDLNWSKIEHMRYYEEYHFIKRIFLNQITENTQCIIFLSTSRSMIIALKHFFNNNKYDKLVLAIPHAILKEIEDKSSKRFWNFPYKIKKGINLKCPDNLKFIAITKPIYLNIIKHSYASQWIHLDHPIPIRKKIKSNPTKNILAYIEKKLTIGIFGSINYEFSDYFNLLKEIKKSHPDKIEIKIIGHITPNIFNKLDVSFIDYYSTIPISFEDYDNQARSVDIALWFISSSRVRLAASGTILDIFSYEIPVIYKDNELLEYYSSLMGEVGFKIKYETEIIKIIESLIENRFLDKSIIKYKENMRKIHTLFSIETTSFNIKQILDSYVRI